MPRGKLMPFFWKKGGVSLIQALIIKVLVYVAVIYLWVGNPMEKYLIRCLYKPHVPPSPWLILFQTTPRIHHLNLNLKPPVHPMILPQSPRFSLASLPLHLLPPQLLTDNQQAPLIWRYFLWNSAVWLTNLPVFKLVYSSSFHIYVLTETWLSSFFLNRELIPTGFSIYRRDRKSRGGGVMIAVHNSLSSRQLFFPSHLEVLTVEVSVSFPILICVVYIPPSCNSNYLSVTINCVY